MPQKFTNAARSTLQASIIAGATSLTVATADADLFPIANTGVSAVGTAGLDYFKCVLEDVSHNKEIIYVRTRGAGVAIFSNVQRGQEGTTARAYAAGDIVGLRVLAADLESAIKLSADATTAGKAILNAADAATQRTALGTDVQVQTQSATAVTAGGTATAVTITPAPAWTAYTAGLTAFVTFPLATGLNPTLTANGLATPPQLVMQLADGSYVNVAGIPAGHRSRVTLLSATQAWVETLPPAPPGLKNRIINGSMNIDQRNSGAPITVTTLVAALDRFGVANTTATGTLTVQQSTIAGFGKSLRATATAAITALTTTLNARPCYHVIEAQNCFDLNAKTVTLSFTVETNWTGNLAVSVRNSGNTRSYVTNVAVVSGINTRSVVVPIEAATIATNDNATGLNIDIGFCNEATFQTATTGSWLAGDFRTATTSTQWCKTAGNFVNVTQLQLEQSAVATPFEQRLFGLELALCQRYFRFIDGNLRFTASAASQILAVGIQFPDMRASPTVGVMIAKPGGATAIQNTAGITTDRVTPSSVNINMASSVGGDIFALNYYAPATSEYF